MRRETFLACRNNSSIKKSLFDEPEDDYFVSVFNKEVDRLYGSITKTVNSHCRSATSYCGLLMCGIPLLHATIDQHKGVKNGFRRRTVTKDQAGYNE